MDKINKNVSYYHSDSMERERRWMQTRRKMWSHFHNISIMLATLWGLKLQLSLSVDYWDVQKMRICTQRKQSWTVPNENLATWHRLEYSQWTELTLRIICQHSGKMCWQIQVVFSNDFLRWQSLIHSGDWTNTRITSLLNLYFML